MKCDWISPFWQAALIPDRWDVAGIPLGPLTVWHSFALDNTRNAFMFAAPADRDDACSLLIFCSGDYRHGKRLFFDDAFRNRQMFRMYRRLRDIPWDRLERACREYVHVCTRAASRYTPAGQNPQPERVPAQWHMVRLLSQSDPCRLEPAWNTPFAVARALFDAWAESEKDDSSILSLPAQEMEDNWSEYQKQPEPPK